MRKEKRRKTSSREGAAVEVIMGMSKMREHLNLDADRMKLPDVELDSTGRKVPSTERRCSVIGSPGFVLCYYLSSPMQQQGSYIIARFHLQPWPDSEKDVNLSRTKNVGPTIDHEKERKKDELEKKKKM